MRRKIGLRLLSAILSLVLVWGQVPVSVLAAEGAAAEKPSAFESAGETVQSFDQTENENETSANEEPGDESNLPEGEEPGDESTSSGGEEPGDETTPPEGEEPGDGTNPSPDIEEPGDTTNPSPEIPADQIDAAAADDEALTEELLAALPLMAPAAVGNITVYITLEGYNLGQGYYIEPTALTLPAGATAEAATRKLLEDKHLAYTDGGTGDRFYLSSVAGIDKRSKNPPSYITATLGDNADDSLGEFDYTTTSGWMVTVNHCILDAGAGLYSLQDGDVVRWQFTVQGTGADLGVPSASGAGAPLYTHADKTGLIKKLLDPGANPSAQNAALAVAINPLATDDEVAAAIAALESDAVQDVYVNGWFIIYSTDGAMGKADFRTKLDALLIANGMTADDYTHVKKLRLIGAFSGTRAEIFGNTTTGGSVFAGAGDQNDNAVLKYLEELDLADITVSGGFPANAICLRNLKKLRLPPTVGITVSNGNITRLVPSLHALVVGKAPFEDNVWDLSGYRSEAGDITATFTNSQAFGHAPATTAPITNGPKKLIIPEGFPLGANMFQNRSMLEEVVFFGKVDNLPDGLFYFCPDIKRVIFHNQYRPTATQVTSSTNGDKRLWCVDNTTPLNPLPVAYVPNPSDTTQGGNWQAYTTAGGSGHFSQILPLAAYTKDTKALLALLAECKALTAAHYEAVGWAVLQDAIAAADAVLSDPESEQSAVDDARIDLQSAKAALVVNPQYATKIQVPAGAVVGVYQKTENHFTPLISYPVSLTDSNATHDVYTAAGLPLNTTLYVIASKEGATARHVKAIQVSGHGTTIDVNPTPIANWSAVTGSSNNSNFYTNLNDTGTLNLSAGETFTLDTFRVWQATADYINNLFFEPDYTFTTFGDSISVRKVGAEGRRRLEITASKPGVSVIKITYAPVEIVTSSGATLRFNGLDPRNTGVVVVNVNGGGDISTGIAARNDFDTYYFDKTAGTRDFTFKPAAGSSVRVHDPLNSAVWGSGWKSYTKNANDGSFTVRLKDGRNIIEVTNGGNKRFHVVKARGIDVTVHNATNPGRLFVKGDTARISLSGLEEPVEKLAGIYNPGYDNTGFGSPLASYVRYTNSKAAFDSARATQYGALTTTFTVEYALSDTNLHVLNGQLWSGWMGKANSLGEHRSIPLNGVGSNMAAIENGPHGFGALPEIVLPLDYSEAVKQAADALTWPAIKGGNAAANHVTGNLTLPAAGAGEVEISWRSGNTAYVSNTGVVTRPGHADGNRTVTLTAELTKGAAKETVVFTLTVVAAQAPATYSIAMNAALSYLFYHVSDPGVAAIGGEWSVVARARANKNDVAWNEKYLANLRTAIKMAASTTNGKVILDHNKPTENQRVILALTALGLDASDFEGYDFVSPLANNEWVQRQGVNSNAFALIALHSKPYGTVDAQPLLTALLALQKADGGWGLSTASDVDVTAMAIQALAPYYKSNAAVKAAADKALAWLNAQTTLDVEGSAQAVVALSALGQDAQRYVAGLLTFYDEDAGAFKRGAAVNTMATEQAAYALVAYDRFLNGKNALYDMRDAGEITEPPVSDADAVNAAKAALTWDVIKAMNAGRNDVKTHLHLPQAGENGVTIRWSSDSAAISSAGSVTRPAYEAGSQAVVLTALLTKGAANATVTFHLTVTCLQGGSVVGQEKPKARISVTDPNATGGQTKTYFAERELELDEDETAFSLLQRTGLSIRTASYSQYAGIYVEAINGFGEFDDGPLSGWMYRVNGVFPDYSSSLYTLRDGDLVEWVYTRDLGSDVNDPNAAGAGMGAEILLEIPAVTTPPVIVKTDDGNIAVITAEAVVRDDGTAVAEIAPEAVTELVAAAKTAKAAHVMISAGAAEKVSAVEVSLTVQSVGEIASGGMRLTVESVAARITFDVDTLKGIAEEHGRSPDEKVRIVASMVNAKTELNDRQRLRVGDNPTVIDLSVYVGETRIRRFRGMVTAAVAFSPDPALDAADYDLLTVYYLDEAGNSTEMTGARYDEETGEATFTTAHFSKFFVSEWQSPFDDITKADAFYKTVRYVYDSGLMAGVSDTAFAPDANISRAMIVTLLWRKEGAPASQGAAFTDVEAGEWYADAIAWAGDNGIVSGYGDGTFGPDDPITGEQLAVITHRYAQYRGLGASVDANAPVRIANTGAISAWAADAMRWADANGLAMRELAPSAQATRAQAAVTLHRFVENVDIREGLAAER